MTDQECAVILRRICDSWPYHGPTFAKEHAALERAIEVLDPSEEWSWQR